MSLIKEMSYEHIKFHVTTNTKYIIVSENYDTRKESIKVIKA